MPDEDSGLGIGLEYEEGVRSHSQQSKTMHDMHGSGRVWLGLAKTGCAWAAQAADWGKWPVLRLLNPSPSSIGCTTLPHESPGPRHR